MAIDTFFKNIADAIRTKGGTVATLTPAQMPQAIADLPSGGSSNYIEPVQADFQNGFANGSTWLRIPGAEFYADLFEVESGHTYKFMLGVNNKTSTTLSAIRSILTNDNTYTTTTNLSGQAAVNVNNPDNYYTSPIITVSGYQYLTICKQHNPFTTGVYYPTCLIDITDL